MTNLRIARACVAVIFFATLSAAAWVDRHPIGLPASVSEFGFAMRECARECGIDFVHVRPVIDARLANIGAHVAGVGAAVSLVDYDGDGRLDVFATNSGTGSKSSLYWNRGDGTFEDRAAAAGLADLDPPGSGSTMGSIWADVDDDGDLDCFLYRWGPQDLRVQTSPGRFEPAPADAGLPKWMNSCSACFLDFDRDGLVDLYVTGYFRDDVDLEHLTSTRIMQESFEFANNGGTNRLLRNRGGCRFEDVTATSGCASTRWTLACASADFDGDDWPDLYLANDYGPEELFRNRKDGTFELARDVGLKDDSKSGMAVAVGDVKNEGHPSVFVTNISRAAYLFQGNNLRWNRLRAEGRFENIAEQWVADCGWAWGAQFGDLNNDGWQDLFVVNGFVSANPNRDYWFEMSKIATGAANAFIDAERWPPMEDRTLSGYEPSRVLVSRAGQGFREVGQAVGVTDLLDGRGVAFGDLFDRGALDAVIANQAGPLLVYRNQVAPDRHWIQFRLKGTRSNRAAIGASVAVEWSGGRQRQTVCAGSGFASQNDLRLHFGLGAAKSVDRVEIIWPDGRHDVREGLAIDRLHAIEEAP